MIVAFTGHRELDVHKRAGLRGKLLARLGELKSEHSELTAISGMAVGFDTLAASVCAELEIPFDAYVPFAGQSVRWPLYAQKYYRELIAKACTVRIISPGGYAPGKMQRRNEAMVDACDLLIAAWSGSAGGTANCVRYAEKVDRKVENLW